MVKALHVRMTMGCMVTEQETMGLWKVMRCNRVTEYYLYNMFYSAESNEHHLSMCLTCSSRVSMIDLPAHTDHDERRVHSFWPSWPSRHPYGSIQPVHYVDTIAQLN